MEPDSSKAKRELQLLCMKQCTCCPRPHLSEAVWRRLCAIQHTVAKWAPLRQPPEEVLAVHEALCKLAETDTRAAELVKLRYFAGFTLKEAAEVLGVAPRTADDIWACARAWLAAEIQSTQ